MMSEYWICAIAFFIFLLCWGVFGGLFCAFIQKWEEKHKERGYKQGYYDGIKDTIKAYEDAGYHLH